MSSSFPNQIDNRNFLSPIGFKFSLAKEPKISFFCNSARIPDITLSLEIQPTYLKDIDIPGDKLTYGDLSLKFIVDENMENYMSVHNWLTGLGFPESTNDYTRLISEENDVTQPQDPKKAFSDGTLYILNSNYNTVATVKFKNLFPVSLSSLEFDSTQTDVTYLTAEVIFKYTIYEIDISKTQPLRKDTLIQLPKVLLTNSAEGIIPLEDTFFLDYESENATFVTITNGIGKVEPGKGRIELKASDFFEYRNGNDVIFTIKAFNSAGRSSASTTVRIGNPQTSSNRVCIAVIDENLGSQTFEGMEQKWRQFRQNWPNRVFYLLQPNEGQYTDTISTLHVPPSFLEETDPDNIDL